MQVSDCCSASSRPESQGRCPGCASKGAPVNELTIKALLSEAAMHRFAQGAYRFCAAPLCPVVYFDDVGRTFETSDVRVAVWQKQPSGNRMVCYCFGETEASIREEVRQHGRSAALERVRAHIAAKHCACEIRNPKGVCCLGDLTAALKTVSEHVEDRETR